MQSNEQAETKKRKGAVKDDGKKFKKQKTGKGNRDGLTLNAATKCVEILHTKVKDLKVIRNVFNFFGNNAVNPNVVQYSA